MYLKIGPNRPNWQCCLAGSSKTAPRILIFSIAMGADHSFYMKTIETHVRTFLPLNISALCKTESDNWTGFGGLGGLKLLNFLYVLFKIFSLVYREK